MRISVSIMSHKSRVFEARTLLAKLEKMPFVSISLVTDKDNNEWETGKRALRERYHLSDYTVCLQDDAIISDTFYKNLCRALEALPQQSLLSLYLGQTKPYPSEVKASYERALAADKSFLQYQTLLWGVGIAIPTIDIESMLAHAKTVPKMLYDRRVGEYFKTNGRPVYYTTVSLVDHNDSLPSLLGHDKRRGQRVAHSFVGDKVLEFNSEVEEIK